MIINGEDTIILRWDAKCAVCGCVMPADTRVRYVKEAKSGLRVMHLASQACGGQYTIKAIYHSTSKVVKVTEYNAQAALDKARKSLLKGKYTALPSAYIVFQGNIPVLTATEQLRRSL